MTSTTKTPSESSNTVYFWRPQDNNSFLSQWYPSPFTHEGTTYATAEMWMMIQKAKLFKDEEIASKMAATNDPKEHQALGRKVRNYDGKLWDENKLRIVEEGSYLKFTTSAGLKPLLLATGDRELVEASPVDKIWGIGFGEKDAEENRKYWSQNLLGIALMNARTKIQEEEANEKKA
ncbi:DUF1768-domain-containing protein [Tothia fuscella]|uniref:DUF1768-domain-containing protein n=1 Tax=Tothia fuscella TaxID=1048955 RepID=A0A9P4NV14_9PEZI|nr:DUF1768-domain-containing protein [Tothia fuscella]